ncbi:unnamed protein product, partial [Rotaria sp. Silwood2]
MSSHCEIRGDSICSTMYHGGLQRSRLIQRRHSLCSKRILMIKCNGVQNNFGKKYYYVLLIALMDNQELRTDQITRWIAQSKMIVFLCEQSYVQERQDKYWKCVEL